MADKEGVSFNQQEEWVYASGLVGGHERLLAILGVEPKKLEKESD